VGLSRPKKRATGRYSSGPDAISRGKSHARWFPACRQMPSAIAVAMILWKAMPSSKGTK